MRRFTARERVMVAAAAALAIAVPMYALVFGPEVRALAVAGRHVQAQSVQLAAAAADADRVPELERERAAESATLRRAEHRIPAVISISGLMGRLSAAIGASGVQLVEVTFPQGTQPAASSTDPIQELALTVRLRGTFDHVVRFLRAMEAAPPVAVEESLTLADAAPSPAGQRTLDITIAMKAIAVR